MTDATKPNPFFWPITIGVCAIVGGSLVAAYMLGRGDGFDDGVAHEQRYNVTWMANEAAAATDVMSRGGTVETLTVADGWQATVRIDGREFTDTNASREQAVLNAVAKWKNL